MPDRSLRPAVPSPLPSGRPVVPSELVLACESPDVLLRVKIPAVRKQHLDRMARQHNRKPAGVLAVALREYFIKEYLMEFYGLKGGKVHYPPETFARRTP